jgi:branched-chain amino acid transport system permease protein
MFKQMRPGSGLESDAGPVTERHGVKHLAGDGRLLKACSSLLLVALLVAVPFALNSYLVFVINLVIIYAVATLGFDILVGWSGQLGLAHAALFAVGAYGSTLAAEVGIPFLLTIPLAALFAALLAVAMGAPAVRLRGFFLAIVTLAFGLVVVQVITSAGKITGGGGGIAAPGWHVGALTHEASIYFLSVVVGVVIYFVSWRVLRDRFGHNLKAIRSMGTLAGSVGIPVTKYRLVAFALSGFVGSVAGSLYSQLQTFIFPGMFSLNALLVPFLVMLFVGGSGTIWGSAVGAVFVVVLIQLLQGLGTVQSLAYGVALMLAIAFLRGGLVSLLAEVRSSRVLRRAVSRSSTGSAQLSGSDGEENMSVPSMAADDGE